MILLQELSGLQFRIQFVISVLARLAPHPQPHLDLSQSRKMLTKETCSVYMCVKTLAEIDGERSEPDPIVNFY